MIAPTKTRFLVEILCLSMTFTKILPPALASEMFWMQLPPLPDPIGVAGAFAGVSGGHLIIGGGANFPGQMPWEGGTKVWHRDIYVLKSPDSAWETGFQLPRPAAYGISATIPEGVLCIGGSDSKQHLTNVFVLSLNEGKFSVKDLPALPFPLANSCGAILDGVVYVAGGTEGPEATNALRCFLHLDLSARNSRWEELPAWPGPARMLSIAAALQSSFFVVGGTDLHPGPQGKPSRSYLKDGYRFTPGLGWRRIADLPNPVVAAPSPAPIAGDHEFLLIGGDDGSLLGIEPKSHPGFPKRAWVYQERTDSWRLAGASAPARATLPTVHWRGMEVLASGELRPGVRSPEVWAMTCK